MPSQREPVENGVDGGLRGALAVGVLDSQQHLAAAAAGVEPVEQRGARAADMQKTGGRGGETGDDGHSGVLILPGAGPVYHSWKRKKVKEFRFVLQT